MMIARADVARGPAPDTVRAHFLRRSLPALLATLMVVWVLATIGAESEAAGCAGTPLIVGDLTLPELTQPA